MRILILWRKTDYEIRNTHVNHLQSFVRHDKENEYFYFQIYNGRYEKDYEWITQEMFDAVIFHYTALELRGREEYWNSFVENMGKLWREYPCCKIVMSQDDYTFTGLIWDLIEAIHPHLLYTINREKDHAILYPKDKIGDCRVETVLTGYVEKAMVNTADYIPHIYRKYDMVYRARKLSYGYGKLGQLKTDIVRIFSDAMKGSGLKTDIAATVDNAGALLGDEWIHFLLNARTVIGCLSGASIVDVRGDVLKSVEEYVVKHPDAEYEEVKNACFPQKKEELSGMIAPRNFESALTKTCQVLIGDDYQGILIPDVDYIMVRPDYGNLEEVIEKVKDISYCQEIAETCYRHIVESGRYDYAEFVKKIVNDIKRITEEKTTSRALSALISEHCENNNRLVELELQAKMKNI